MAGSGSMASSPTLYKELPYDPRKDFAPRACGPRSFHPVRQSLVADRIGHRPDQLCQGPSGCADLRLGGRRLAAQLFVEMFKTMTGIEMTHVSYKGSAPALTDVIGGHIALLFARPAPALPLIKF